MRYTLRMGRFLLGIDQGTTGSTCLIIDERMQLRARITCEFPQHYPKPGWVEHDPEELWRSVQQCISQAIGAARISTTDIAGIGITNQRETTLVWDRTSGAPLAPAIVWQDRRTAELCQKLASHHGRIVRTLTGLRLDPYFSATKLMWLLKNISGLRRKAASGDAIAGTVDSFLLWRLTGGAMHATDASNASRTLLMNIHRGEWDNRLLALFDIPREMLPEITSSAGVVGHTRGLPMLPDGIPIAGIAGDQQAALFGQACFRTGDAKCTYGTGSFLMLNTGAKPITSRSGLLTTIAWKLGHRITYALEGSAFIAGAAVQWLRDELGIIRNAADVEHLAAQVPSSDGVVLIPAFTGLGAPQWQPDARGVLCGLTRGSSRAHIARATLEGIAFLQHDILRAMERDVGRKLRTLKVDGGAAANTLLMQFQSDIVRTRLIRPQISESTSFGAALLAGLGLKWWPTLNAIAQHWKADAEFHPQMSPAAAREHLARWNAALNMLTSSQRRRSS